MTTRRILYVQYTNPAGYPPLEHSSRILADAGWDVMFLGTGAFGANSLRFAPHARIRVRQLPFCPPGWRQKIHYAWFTLWVVGWVLRWNPDWVYASDYLSSPVGFLVALLLRQRVIYHEHDSPPSAGGSKFLSMCHWARRNLAHRAVACILPNEARVSRFIQDTRCSVPVHCIWNCPSRAEVVASRAPTGDDSFWVLYHGSIVSARFPPTVIEALAILPPRVKMRVIGYTTVGRPAYVTELRTLASLRGVSDRIEFVGPVPCRTELMAWCAQHDVGISFMPMKNCNLDEDSMVGASNKPFDYLACGLSLVVSDLPDWRELYVNAGYGLACNPHDPESIARSVRWFLDHPVEVRGMGERGRQRILEEWNYESQFAPVQTLIGRCATPSA